MNADNIILATDSYKLTHWKQYPKDTQGIFSYFESRYGAKYGYTVFFGLQYVMEKYLAGKCVTLDDINEAKKLADVHLGPGMFNLDGWMHILLDHGGKLPLKIRAVPEGTVVPTGNVMMTVENTCDKCFWLTNAVESILTHVWYSSTVATMSRAIKKDLLSHVGPTGGDLAGVDFMLHDFGYRGATSHEAAAVGGAGHLVNFKGTDTLPAMILAMDYYKADLENLAFSVPATEHSVMTAKGDLGEMLIVDRLIDEHPAGILSVVADSYDIYNFVDKVGTVFKDRILARDGVFVVRPDSVTITDSTPTMMSRWCVQRLWKHFGGTVNAAGFKVLDPHVRVLYGDGIDQADIKKILGDLQVHGFASENMVFGMGGGLLQKVNRDTQRFAFKCSARKVDGVWQDVFKRPLDAPHGQTKQSKKGRMSLFRLPNGGMFTDNDTSGGTDLMSTVFENGEIKKRITFDEIRENAKL